jgi:CheY-like chemotaxis protein
MDDEDAIRKILKEMLEYLGYRVLSSSNGEEAIALYKETRDRGEKIDAVILDLTIPGGMGGRETVQELKKIDQGITAIASSGYSQTEEVGKYLEFGFSAFVPKPFRLEDISEALHSVNKTNRD